MKLLNFKEKQNKVSNEVYWKVWDQVMDEIYWNVWKVQKIQTDILNKVKFEIWDEL